MAWPEDLAAVVLAGGRGTRLRAAVPDRPKPLADVAGRTILDRLLDKLQAEGARHTVVSIGYRAEMIVAHLQRRPAGPMEIATVTEDRPLGTGGGLRQALRATDAGRLLVLNGDSFLGAPFAALAAHQHDTAAPIALYATEVADCGRYGALDLDAKGYVRAFLEKDSDRHGPGPINAGIYVIDRAVAAALPAGQVCSLESDLFPGYCDGRLAALITRAAFIDIGTPEALARGQAFFARRDASSPPGGAWS